MTSEIPRDIRYATTNNFTHQKLYDSADCYLRPDTARKLTEAAKDAQRLGYRLKVFDCYRPLSIQRRMWEIVHDDRYVADPAKGSRHNRGAAVDLTMTRADGSEIPMPTPYDEFSEKAHRDYTNLSKEALDDRRLLEEILQRHGFVGLPTEWWHFDDAEWQKYAVLDERIP